MSTQTILKISGYDANGIKTIGCNTSVLSPDVTLEQWQTYMRDKYVDWVYDTLYGLSHPGTIQAGKDIAKRAVNKTVTIKVTEG